MVLINKTRALLGIDGFREITKQEDVLDIQLMNWPRSGSGNA
jgi:hypothetical protein